MNIVFKILLYVLMLALGFILMPFMINLAIFTGLIDSGNMNADAVQSTLGNSILIWIAASVLALSYFLFQKKTGQIACLLCPVIIPSLYLLIQLSFS